MSLQYLHETGVLCKIKNMETELKQLINNIKPRIKSIKECL